MRTPVRHRTLPFRPSPGLKSPPRPHRAAAHRSPAQLRS
jgi:hypothetical protein